MTAKKSPRFAGSSFLNVRIFCFNSLLVTVHEKSLGFGQVAGQKQHLKTSLWDSGKYFLQQGDWLLAWPMIRAIIQQLSISMGFCWFLSDCR